MAFPATEHEKCLDFKIGMPVRLRPDAFPYVKIREWEIDQVGSEKILLSCSRIYTLLRIEGSGDEKEILSCPKNYTLEVLPGEIECLLNEDEYENFT